LINALISDVGADGVDFCVRSPFCVFHLEWLVFAPSKLLLLRMLNQKNKGRQRLGGEESAKSVARLKKIYFRHKRSEIYRSSYAYKFRILARLYLRLGLGLGEAFLQAEADLNEFAW
jgi:hypothetical protein